MKGYEIEIDRNRKEIWISKEPDQHKTDVESSNYLNILPRLFFQWVAEERIKEYLEYKKEMGYKIMTEITALTGSSKKKRREK